MSSSLSSVVSNLVRAQMGSSLSGTVTDEELDRHVAELILKEAKKKAERYSQDGIRAYLRNNLDANAPKTNKRFLSSIIRSTDDHNKTLLRAQALAAQEIKRLREEEERRERRARAQEAVEAEQERMRGSGSRRASKRRRREDSWDRWDGRSEPRNGSKLRGWEMPSRLEEDDREDDRHESRRRRSRERSEDRSDRQRRSHRSRRHRSSHKEDGHSSSKRKRRNSRSPSIEPSSHHRRRRSRKSRSPSASKVVSDSDNRSTRQQRGRRWQRSPDSQHVSSRSHSSYSPEGPRAPYVIHTRGSCSCSRKHSPSPSGDPADREAKLRRKLKGKYKAVEDTTCSSRRNASPPSHTAEPPSNARSPSRSPSRTPTPGPDPQLQLPSKMDKYFEESYDPRLDIAPLAAPKVPATGLISDAEFEGWDAMLELLRQRREDKEDRKRLERLGLLPPKAKVKGVKKALPPVGSSGVNERWESGNSSVMEIEYAKRGSVREWDLGKEGF